MVTRIYLYTRFERLWHWIQALLVIFLLLSGFEIHGTYKLLGFDTAVRLHNIAGLSWAGLYVFALFWIFTTGEWRQYTPKFKNVALTLRYYVYDIFKGHPSPMKKTTDAKHNPIQRLAYLGLLGVIIPAQLLGGLFYYGYKAEHYPTGVLQFMSVGHTIGAFFFLAFLVAHLYLATTGHTPLAYIKGMIKGYEEVPEDH